ncbi:MAG: cold-shock protein [Alphaproteobacteria bacterium]|jgi:CspA family cold shock protein|nr:MAG: cold-shock protein [Alphaproteobacteria bacterium]|tara:strand:- start:184 stop:390 length:207 start_codon:yes stop_codon:yes gene_type:complete
MKTGSVKWFNPSKGYGFISPDGGGKDIFVHISALETSGIKNLSENQKVSYDEARNKDKISAGNIKLID